VTSGLKEEWYSEYLIEYLTEGGAADIENIRTKERKYKTGGE